MKKIQIGIMGSAADLNYSKETKKFSKKIGELIAKSENILVYGAEKEYTSLSTEAAKEASKYNGITIGVTGGKDKKINGKFKPTILINTGLEIDGGSGTLTEIAIAYQARIPIIVVDKFGGWTKELSSKYLDERKRIKCLTTTTAEEALKKAIKEVEKYNNKIKNDKITMRNIYE